MLCFDTSSLIAYLEGAGGSDVDLIDQALSDEVGVISPITITELLSDFKLGIQIKKTILELPFLPILENFWERAGLLRAKVLRQGNRAPLADTLIAQNCLDHRATLVTRDRDFRVFKKVGGLILLEK